MLNYEKQFEEMAGKLENLKDVSMNSFQYQLYRLVASYYPTNKEEFADCVYAIISTYYALCCTTAGSLKKGKELAFDLIETYFTMKRKEEKNEQKQR